MDKKTLKDRIQIIIDNFRKDELNGQKNFACSALVQVICSEIDNLDMPGFATDKPGISTK